jgi:hypothetical protein
MSHDRDAGPFRSTQARWKLLETQDRNTDTLDPILDSPLPCAVEFDQCLPYALCVLDRRSNPDVDVDGRPSISVRGERVRPDDEKSRLLAEECSENVAVILVHEQSATGRSDASRGAASSDACTRGAAAS